MRGRPLERAMRRLLLLAALSTFALPAASAAAAATLPPGSTVLGDGLRSLLIAMPGTEPVIVDDHEQVTRGTPVPLPAGCAVGAFSPAWLLATCPGTDQLLDRATGTWGPMAGEERLRAEQDTVDHVEAIGTELVQVSVLGFKSFFSVVADLQTGAQVDAEAGPRQYATLDTPTGVAPLCAPVRTRTRREENDIGYPVRVRQSAWQAGGWTLRWFQPGRALLQRCGSARTTVLARGLDVRPVLTARYAAWAADGRLHVRWLATGRTVDRRLPTATGYPELTATEARIAADLRVYDLR